MNERSVRCFNLGVRLVVFLGFCVGDVGILGYWGRWDIGMSGLGCK